MRDGALHPQNPAALAIGARGKIAYISTYEKGVLINRRSTSQKYHECDLECLLSGS